MSLGLETFQPDVIIQHSVRYVGGTRRKRVGAMSRACLFLFVSGQPFVVVALAGTTITTIPENSR